MEEAINKLERAIAKAKVALVNQEELGNDPYDAEITNLTKQIREMTRDVDAHIHQLLCLQQMRKAELIKHL